MDSQNYYSRSVSVNSDGTPLFASDYDKSNEAIVRRELSKIWGCEIVPFGRLCPIDFYAVRHGRLVGVLEIKCRSHDSTKFGTVFLNVRKWLSLLLAGNGLGVPALFVVKFTDCMKYVRVSEVEASRIKIGGCARVVKSSSDIEPVIEVDVSQMLFCNGNAGEAAE